MFLFVCPTPCRLKKFSSTLENDARRHTQRVLIGSDSLLLGLLLLPVPALNLRSAVLDRYFAA